MTPAVAPDLLRRSAEILFVAGALLCVVPGFSVFVTVGCAVLGAALASIWPVASWSREDRLIAFAPWLASLTLMWVSISASHNDPLFITYVSSLLLVPLIGLFARVMRFGWFAVLGLVVPFLMAFLPVVFELASLEPRESLPGSLSLMFSIGFLVLLGVTVRQFAWGLRHRRLAIKVYASLGIAFAIFTLPLLALILGEDPGQISRADLGDQFARSLVQWPTMALLLGVTWGAMRAREDELAERGGHSRKETLSVAIICKDEADRIENLLKAVHGWADEIVVLDSGSSDDTVAIARRYTDQVHETDWPGYGVQKRRAVEHCTKDWVLSLDADEVPSEALKSEIDLELDGSGRFDAYRFPWVSIVFGGPVYFGADGRLHLRLFKREGPAGFNDAGVHEGIVGAERVRTLHGWVEHHTFRDAEHARAKFRDYAEIQADERFQRGKRATRLGAHVRGVVSFILLYIGRLGILDGVRGLTMARLYARYTRDKYLMLAALSDR